MKFKKGDVMIRDFGMAHAYIGQITYIDENGYISVRPPPVGIDHYRWNPNENPKYYLRLAGRLSRLLYAGIL